jgi:hypothetical protein
MEKRAHGDGKHSAAHPMTARDSGAHARGTPLSAKEHGRGASGTAAKEHPAGGPLAAREIELMNAYWRAFAAIRDRVLAAKHVATCLEFGPRFLHSTGQAYKGGPNTGVFVQITCDDPADLPVPGQKSTFGV